jgi:DNA-binding transcriptional MerR regulator
MRIGTLSKRTGVSPELLRAWERRYALLQPPRSSGGFRLYSRDDEARINRMKELLASGVAASEAASLAARASDEAAPRLTVVPAAEGIAGPRSRLREAIVALDEPAAQAVLDDMFAVFDVDTVLKDVLLPELHDIGEGWAEGTVSVDQEHFGSHVIEGRLQALARGWGHGAGPRAILACPPGEQHALPLLMFGIALHRRGWRVTYLGADTPVASLGRAVDMLRPALVVVASPVSSTLLAVAGELRDIASRATVAVAGAGASRDVAEACGARLLGGDPVTAAANLAIEFAA